jgi:hypothetical protein
MLLAATEQIPCTIPKGGKPTRPARMIRMRRIHRCATALADLFYTSAQIVHPNVWQQSTFASRLAPGHPRVADHSASVIETRSSTFAMPDIPAEQFFVKRSRYPHVLRRNLQVAKARPLQPRNHRFNLRGCSSPLPGVYVRNCLPQMSTRCLRGLQPCTAVRPIRNPAVHGLVLRRLVSPARSAHVHLLRARRRGPCRACSGLRGGTNTTPPCPAAICTR